VRILRQVIDKLPGGAINVARLEKHFAPNRTVMTKMEELIHHFIGVTRDSMRHRRGYFAADTLRGSWAFTCNTRAGAYLIV